MCLYVRDPFVSLLAVRSRRSPLRNVQVEHYPLPPTGRNARRCGFQKAGDGEKNRFRRIVTDIQKKAVAPSGIWRNNGAGCIDFPRGKRYNINRYIFASVLTHPAAQRPPGEQNIGRRSINDTGGHVSHLPVRHELRRMKSARRTEYL